MEESVKNYIVKRSSIPSMQELTKNYLTQALLIHPEIKSPIEQLFFIEWHFQKRFFFYDEYTLVPQYKNQEITGKYIVDFMVISFIDSIRIAIEIDGHDFHEKTKEQVRHDKKRERFITKNVTKFLRFSGSEIYKNPLMAIEEVRELIDKIEEERGN